MSMIGGLKNSRKEARENGHKHDFNCVYVGARILHGKKWTGLLTVTVNVTERAEPPIRLTGGGRLGDASANEIIQTKLREVVDVTQ
jgi:hypothetical protein